MPIGMSIHVGLNAVSPDHYSGWSGELTACEFDANDMELLAKSVGYTTTTLLTADATRDNVKVLISRASAQLVEGDICLISYSGHGSQVPDLNSDEDDAMDETWCLFDGQLADDEFFKLLAGFREGVRVVVLSDSCHSGTVLKDQALAMSNNYTALLASEVAGDLQPLNQQRPMTVYRAMPSDLAVSTYLANKTLYDRILSDETLANAENEVVAACVLISGCQDNQLSRDGLYNGVFTAQLKRVWNGGKFTGSYAAFRDKITSNMPMDQTPNLYTVGKGYDDLVVQSVFQI